MISRSILRRWHVWLGWLIGLPMLFWTGSGLVMVWKPIDEVRGSDLLREPAPARLRSQPLLPQLAGVSFERLSLEQRAVGPRWIVRLSDGTTRMADPVSGALLPPVSAADAAREVASRYVGPAHVAAVTRTDAAKPPIDLRRPVPTWAIEMSDGTRFYVDAGSGEVIARRTRWWRFYDWMWGLHIMDLDTREDTHNPWIVTFGALALVSTLMALFLLPLTIRRKRGDGGSAR